jgi:hypothetical protein
LCSDACPHFFEAETQGFNWGSGKRLAIRMVEEGTNVQSLIKLMHPVVPWQSSQVVSWALLQFSIQHPKFCHFSIASSMLQFMSQAWAAQLCSQCAWQVSPPPIDAEILREHFTSTTGPLQRDPSFGHSFCTDPASTIGVCFTSVFFRMQILAVHSSRRYLFPHRVPVLYILKISKNGLQRSCKMLQRIWPRSLHLSLLFFPLLCLKVMGSSTVQGLTRLKHKLRAQSGLEVSLQIRTERIWWYHAHSKGLGKLLTNFDFLILFAVTNAISWSPVVWKLFSAPRY